MIYSTNYSSPVGPILLAGNSESLVGLWIEGQKYFGDTVDEAMTENANISPFNAVKYWLDEYFAGQKPAISDLPLAPNGNVFRTAVWDILCEIPYGEVITYANIAGKIATRMKRASMSSQAIGGAVGHNPISIIIPCHRVVGTNGSLTGYAGGLDIKYRLLENEGADMSRLFKPTKGTAL